MAGEFQTKIVFRALDKLSAPLRRIKKSLGGVREATRKASNRFALMQQKTKALRDSLNKVGSKLKSVGQKMTTRLTLPIAFAGAAVLRVAYNFEKSINKVGAVTRTIIGGKVTPDFKRLEAEALKLGKTTEFSSTQAADAMVLLGRAGFSANEILASTADVLAMASANGTDLAFAADVMAKTIRQFGLDASEAARVADVLSEVSRRTNVSLETIFETFQDAGPIGKMYGASLEQVAALTGLLGDVGIDASKAGTAIKNIMLKLAKPSELTKKIIEKLKISFVDLKTGGMKPVGQLLTELGPALAKFPKKAQLFALNELFGLRGIAGASALMSRAMDEGKDPVAALVEILKQANGTSKDMQQTMLRGSVGAIARFQSALEGLGLAFAKSGLLDAFTYIADKLTGFFSALSSVNPKWLKMATITLAVLAAIGPLAAVIGSLIMQILVIKVALVVLNVTFWALLLPIIKVVAIVAALIAIGILLVKNWDKVKAFFLALWDSPIGKFIKFFTPIGWLITIVSEIIKHWEEVKTFFIGMYDLLIDIWETFAPWFSKKVIKPVAGFLDPLITAVRKPFDEFFDWISEKISWLSSSFFGILAKAPKFLRSKLGIETAEQRREQRVAPLFGEERRIDETSKMSRKETKLIVDFRNMPNQTKMRQEGSKLDDIDLKYGFQGASF